MLHECFNSCVGEKNVFQDKAKKLVPQEKGGKEIPDRPKDGAMTEIEPSQDNQKKVRTLFGGT